MIKTILATKIKIYFFQKYYCVIPTVHWHAGNDEHFLIDFLKCRLHVQWKECV